MCCYILHFEVCVQLVAMNFDSYLQHEHANSFGLRGMQVPPLAELLPLAAAGAVVEMLLACRHDTHLAVGGHLEALAASMV